MKAFENKTLDSPVQDRIADDDCVDENSYLGAIGDRLLGYKCRVQNLKSAEILVDLLDYFLLGTSGFIDCLYALRGLYFCPCQSTFFVVFIKLSVVIFIKLSCLS